MTVTDKIRIHAETSGGSHQTFKCRMQRLGKLMRLLLLVGLQIDTTPGAEKKSEPERDICRQAAAMCFRINILQFFGQRMTV